FLPPLGLDSVLRFFHITVDHAYHAAILEEFARRNMEEIDKLIDERDREIAAKRAKAGKPPKPSRSSRVSSRYRTRERQRGRMGDTEEPQPTDGESTPERERERVVDAGEPVWLLALSLAFYYVASFRPGFRIESVPWIRKARLIVNDDKEAETEGEGERGGEDGEPVHGTPEPEREGETEPVPEGEREGVTSYADYDLDDHSDIDIETWREREREHSDIEVDEAIQGLMDVE
ncbi:hypothetical protein KIPB_012860, partial [Kipferlia bialata]